MFLDSLDIANRALNHCGVNPILNVTEDTTSNFEVSAVYDKVRRAELRRNSWRFAIRKTVLRPVTPTMLTIVPALYQATKTYNQGELVEDVNKCIWISEIAANLGNPPGGNNEAWDMYFGPMTADTWMPTAGNIANWSSGVTYTTGQQTVGSDGRVYTATETTTGNNPTTDAGVHWLNTGVYDTSTTGYYAGEIAYIISPTSPSGFQLYLSLTNGNTDTPNVSTPYSASAQYNLDQVVSYLGSNWKSLLPANIGNTPTVPPALWSSIFSYVPTQQAVGSDNLIYTAILGTVGNDPTLDNGVHWTNTGVLAAWTNTPTLLTQDVNWRAISCGLKNLLFVYPVGAGPSTQSSTDNVFRLPAGYVGPAAQNPKGGLINFLGGPSGNIEPDWELEGNFIVSSWTTPILFRFTADVTKVRSMDDMFCEGLACRIAGMVCKRLTGSDTLLQTISGMYKTFMGEARLKNGIETGTEEEYEDDYITVRM